MEVDGVGSVGYWYKCYPFYRMKELIEELVNVKDCQICPPMIGTRGPIQQEIRDCCRNKKKLASLSSSSTQY